MNRLTIRVWMTAALMILGWLGTAWVRAGYTYEVSPLKRSLDNLPVILDGYRGSDAPIDEEVLKILNADAFVNRSYQRPDGSAIGLHASAWIRPESMNHVALHSPKICYVNAGWKVLEERNIQVNTSAGNLPLCVLHLQHEEQRCVVAFWYQMGRSLFNTIGEARSIHRELWGKKRWPATVKVLIQAKSQTMDSALPQIEEFAKAVFDWTIDL